MPFCPSKRPGRNQALVERCSATSDASFCGASLAHAWHGSKGSSHARGVAAGCRVIEFALNHHRVAVSFWRCGAEKRRCLGCPFGVGDASHPLPGGSCQTRVSLEAFEKATRLNSTSSFFLGRALLSAQLQRERERDYVQRVSVYSISLLWRGACSRARRQRCRSSFDWTAGSIFLVTLLRTYWL